MLYTATNFETAPGGGRGEKGGVVLKRRSKK
nr:MAG TPA: hypothetical protein [Caudoviricetes sp.]